MNKRDSYRAELIARQVGKPGLRGRINAFCISCIYDPYDEGTWRKQVEKCTASTCPLFDVRPVSEST